MEPLIFIGFIALAAGAWFLQRWLKQKRREEWQRVASQMGFTYYEHDPFGMLGLPFGLFTKGDGRGVENVARGDHKDRDTTVFEYWYYDESTDSEGRRSKTYHRFTCAALVLPMPLPGVSVAPEGFFSRIADRIGRGDIDFESEEFNRAYEVNARDRRFATYLIDPRMMRWLLHVKAGWRWEIAGNHLLCYCDRLRPPEAFQLVGALHGFLDKTPDVVWNVYGSE